MANDNLARKQIYMPATKPESEITLRVAAYCRVSTDSDDQRNSFAAQNTHYSELILSHDRWEMVDIYADAGITGTSAKKRPDFQRMLADCRKGKIDKVLVNCLGDQEQQKILSYLRTLPTHLEVTVNGKKFYLVHGFPGENVHDEVWGRPTRSTPNPVPDYQLIIGHTPVQYLIEDEQEQINFEIEIESKGGHLRVTHTPGFIDIDCGCGHGIPIFPSRKVVKHKYLKCPQHTEFDIFRLKDVEFSL